MAVDQSKNRREMRLGLLTIFIIIIIFILLLLYYLLLFEIIIIYYYYIIVEETILERGSVCTYCIYTPKQQLVKIL